MRTSEIAWAAGLFEGEGSVVHLGGATSKRWCCALAMVDRDVVEHFFEVVQVGRMYGPYGYRNDLKRKRKHHKPYWRWAVANRDGVLLLYRMFRRWMGVRRLAKLEQAAADVRTIAVTRERKRRFR